MQKSASPLGEGETLNGVKGGDEVDFMQDYAPCGRVILRGVLHKEKALHPPAASVGSFYFCPSSELARLGP